MSAPRNRVLVLNWRDPWHPEGGGSELYVAEVARGSARPGHRRHDVLRALPGRREPPRTATGSATSAAAGTSPSTSGPRCCCSPGRFGRLDAVLEVQNGMPFLARLFTRARVVVLVHHVHREQWSILRPALARFGWFMESKVAVRVNRGTAVRRRQRGHPQRAGGAGRAAPSDITIAWNGQPAPPAYRADAAVRDPAAGRARAGSCPTSGSSTRIDAVAASA